MTYTKPTLSGYPAIVAVQGVKGSGSLEPPVQNMIKSTAAYEADE